MKEKCSKGFREYFVRTLLPAMAMVSAVVISAVPFSCRTSVEGTEFLEGDFSSPKITDVRVVDSNRLSVGFSKNVSVSSASVRSGDGSDCGAVGFELGVDNPGVDFIMEEKMVIGKSYVLDAVLEDRNGNTVTISIDFLGYNDRVPVLALSEIRIKNKSKSDKSEFVELYALSSGNLSGVEIVSASDGEGKRYCFPAIEVSKGEYITVHMRNGDKGCIDELDGNLSAASTSDSSPGARDLFADNQSEGRFGTSSDIIFVRDHASGKIMDAFAYTDPEKPGSWDSIEQHAAVVKDSGAWRNGEGENSCDAGSAFATSSLNRESHSACRRNVEKISSENLFSAKDQWYEVSATKEQSPGKKN